MRHTIVRISILGLVLESHCDGVCYNCFFFSFLLIVTCTCYEAGVNLWQKSRSQRAKFWSCRQNHEAGIDSHLLEIGYSHPQKWMAYRYTTHLPTPNSHTHHTHTYTHLSLTHPDPVHPDLTHTDPIYPHVYMDWLWVCGGFMVSVQIVLSECTGIPSVFEGAFLRFHLLGT